MSGSKNGDVEVVAIMTVLSLALLLVPFIPGVRDLPRWIPVHRLVWKSYYREQAARAEAPAVLRADGAGGGSRSARS